MIWKDSTLYTSSVEPEFSFLDLEKKITETNYTLFYIGISFTLLFIVEIVFLFLSRVEKVEALNYISSFIAFYGVFTVFTIHFFFNKSKKEILSKLISRVSVRNLSLSSEQLEKIVSVDVYLYLRRVYIILPRFHTKGKEVLISSVDGLKIFSDKHQVYADQNLIEEKKQELLRSAKEFRFSPLDMLVDLVFFILPFAIISSRVNTSFNLLIAIILGARAFTFFFYIRLYKNSKKQGESSVKKLNVFMNEDLKEGDATMGTRIDFQSVLKAEANSVFMLVSEGRRAEVQQALRHIISNDNAFKDWSLIVPDEKVELEKLKGKSLVLFFPCESKLSHKEALSMVKEAYKVIVVDTSPSLSLPDSLVFYIDHDQRLKKVKVSENVDRLSGDKGLILKNLKESTNLEEFVAHVKQKAKTDSVFYLVFKDTNVNEVDGSDSVFVLPSKEHAVHIESQFPQLHTDMFCKIESSEISNFEELAKSFIANCTYHRILKSQKKTAL